MDHKEQKKDKKQPDKRKNVTDEGVKSHLLDVPGSSCSSKAHETAELEDNVCIKKEKEENEIKKEEMEELQKEHLKHHFTVQFENATDTYPFTCRESRTVLKAIKSYLKEELEKKKWKDENIIIQLGKTDKEQIIATHFPCFLVEDNELLIISGKNGAVEKVQEKHDYFVFYIDTTGGVNAKTKKLFTNNAVTNFKFLCVYGEKGMTIKEALDRDGRFSELENFELSDNANNSNKFQGKTLVDDVDQKKLKICLPKQKKTLPTEQQKEQEKTGSTRFYLDIVHDSGKSVENVLKDLRKDEPEDTKKREEIYKQLRQQFPNLKQWMESRFPGGYDQKALKHEKFGKTQQSFSEVYKIEKLLKMGKSVCKIVVSDVCQGTGFVLFDNLILTNAHLYKGRHDGKVLSDDIKVSALFDYNIPEPGTKCYYFYSEKTSVDIDTELDYAILQLEENCHKLNFKTKADNVKVPPGLLNKFGPLPKDGEACIIGHPSGGLKKIDPTFIIEPERRKQAVDDHLAPYKGTLFTINSIIETIKLQGIEKIMEMKVGTYNTVMYHGASGSPVFHADCKVFGLHTGGFTYGFKGHEQSVIEYAKPLLTIFKKFVNNLKLAGNEEMLDKVGKEAQGNPSLKKIIASAEQDPVGDMDIKSEKVKKEVMEPAGVSKQDDHLHHFSIKFGLDKNTYRVDCKQPSTVLQVIKSHLFKEFKEKINKPEENIIIKFGEGSDSHIVATHFPCSCVEEGTCLTITTSTKLVEKKQKDHRVLPKENYSVFFIDREGGKDTKSKTDQIFRCKNIAEKFRYYCVYGKKRMTVKEALRLDGRFVDNTADFTLSDNETGDLTKVTEIVDNLNGRKFQICLPKKVKSQVKDQKQTTSSEQQEQEERPSVPTNSQNKSQTGTVLEYAKHKGVSLKIAMEESQNHIDLKAINDLLGQQFPKLKKLFESRFPGRSFEKELKLKEEKFGKIQNSFSEVRIVRHLGDLSQSVCLLEIKENSSFYKMQGTGFVLFDNIVLTNAHLFQKWQKSGEEKWRDYLTITVEFNYEKEGKISKSSFQAEQLLNDNDLDYALVEVKFRRETDDIPSGLLTKFGPAPEPGDDGGACITGYPAGGVKKMDITCVIQNEQREKTVNQSLEHYDRFTVCSINYQIKRDPYADIYVTYNSFMYHGSSGSPVFDVHGRVFGLHSGGFFFNYPRRGHSVIEYAIPLLSIFKSLLGKLQEKGMEELLKRVREEAETNPYLKTNIDSVRLNQNKDQTHSWENQQGEQLDSEEEMDTA